jgi:hypothetical protein
VIKDKYYNPVEGDLREHQCEEFDLLNTGRTEELPSEMAERHQKELQSLRSDRMSLNHIQWFKLYPDCRVRERGGMER